jgi:hypothetical protein
VIHKTGVLDGIPAPDVLTGHVVTPDGEPRLHGYAVRADLARNASFADLGWLALTGELPTAAERAAFGVALTWLAPLHVGESPVHAAVLARVAGAPDVSLTGVAAVAIAHHTASEIATVQPLFAWLDGAGEVPPACVLADPDPDSLAAHDEVVRQSAGWFAVPLPARPTLGRVATAYAILHRLGVSDPLRLHALSAWARLPVVLAEAACTRSGGVSKYPLRLPDYTYVEGP